MSDGVRFNFINYSDTDSVTVSVTTTDTIVYQELPATWTPGTPIDSGEVMSGGSQQLTVTPGSLFGFSTDHPATVTAVSGRLTVIIAGGKDPWPQPPPLAPKKLAGPKWPTQFSAFNRASAVDAVSHAIEYLRQASAAASVTVAGAAIAAPGGKL